SLFLYFKSMSSWRENEERPADFWMEIYADDDEVEQKIDLEISDDEDDISCRSTTPEVPPFSPLSSPPHRESRSRSRSPVWVHQSPETMEVVVRIYDENGMPLNDEEEEEHAAFLTPDAHFMFESPEVNVVSERHVRGRRNGRRGEHRGKRGRGLRSGYKYRRVRGKNQWQVGHPLHEIWTTDEDVPVELVSLARDVMRKRQTILQDVTRVKRNKGESKRPVRGDVSESEDDNEFLDASEAPDVLPGLEGQHLTFEWNSMESFQGKEEHFLPKRTGSVRTHNSAYGAFRSYWDDDILGRIVAETNLYATKIVSARFQAEWYPTNVDEILCLFSFWMMLGIVRMPTIYSCFSMDPLLKTEVFRSIFTRKRFEHLTRALTFIDCPVINDTNSSNAGATGSVDRLYLLRPIITHLNSKFQSNYVLDKDICIDESLTLWKGKLDIKQYIRSKASKFGIKTFELCESVTGYLWSFIVYTGKSTTKNCDLSHDGLKSTTIVKKLMAPLLNKGYRLFLDNWYNSPLLARFLKLNGTDCVGTLRPNRRDVPVLIREAPLKRGEMVARHSGDVSVLAWQDKNRVTMISTCHGSATALPRVPSRPLSRVVPFKPQVVLDYNKFMGGVDLKDQMLEPYLLERKRCAKWHMKLFKRLLNVSILNSRILVQSSTKKNHDHLTFRLNLVDSILKNHLSHCPASRRYNNSSIGSETLHQITFRTSLQHWPALLDYSESIAVEKRNFRKRCVVCLREGRKTQKTAFCCEYCRVPLCIKNCFKSYHISSK
ncbi:hypothetical protein evm_014261, partial [Chilo suppressalis]